MFPIPSVATFCGVVFSPGMAPAMGIFLIPSPLCSPEPLLNTRVPGKLMNAVGGIFRREMDEHFDEVRYHRRTLVETKFSVLKRRFGGDLKTRKFSNQRKELSGKMIICNLHQFLQFVMIEVFYRAKLRKKTIKLNEKI